MSSGQRAVWAAEFVRARAAGVPVVQAFRQAMERTMELRAWVHPDALSGMEREMLDDMINDPGDEDRR